MKTLIERLFEYKVKKALARIERNIAEIKTERAEIRLGIERADMLLDKISAWKVRAKLYL